MAVDFAALKRAQQKLDERTGSNGFLSQKSLTGETIVRLLPPSPKLNGLLYLEVKKYWIAGKPYIDCSTFGMDSVIEEELATAKLSKDKDLKALANNTDSKTGVSLKTEMWTALLHLEYTLNKKDQITGVTVVDDQGKVFQCGSQMMSAILKVFSSRKAMTAADGAEDGIADRESGCNIQLSKTGQKLNTHYDALLDEQMEMAVKYYADIPDVYDIAKQQMKSKKYQRAVIRQYLYGEEIPEALEQAEKERAAAIKAENKANAGAAPVKKKKPAATEEEDDDDEPVVKKKKKPAVDDDDDDEEPVVKKKKKPVVEDDDDDEEPAPVKKKKAAPVDDDDDDDEPVAKKKVAPKKKAAPVDDDDDDEPMPAPKKKVAPKKKAVTDDDDDDDEPIPVKKKKAAPVDDDDDDEPVIKKKAVAPKKKAAPVDDDDDDEPIPVKKKKKPVVDDDDDDDEPAPVSKKSAKKTKQILEDLEDLNDDDDE